MNKGILLTTKSGKVAYYKKVNWSKAVIWKDRQISINPDVVRIMFDRVELVIFHDEKKNKCWSADINSVKKNWKLRKIGQEKQYYIPIDIFEEKEVKNKSH